MTPKAEWTWISFAVKACRRFAHVVGEGRGIKGREPTGELGDTDPGQPSDRRPDRLSEGQPKQRSTSVGTLRQPKLTHLGQAYSEFDWLVLPMSSTHR